MLYSVIIKNLKHMKYLSVEPGKDAKKDVHYKYGTLIGTLKGMLLYSDMEEDAFKCGVRALVEVLDPSNVFDASTIKDVLSRAKARGYNVNEIVKEVNLIHE